MIVSTKERVDCDFVSVVQRTESVWKPVTSGCSPSVSDPDTYVHYLGTGNVPHGRVIISNWFLRGVSEFSHSASIARTLD